jgi:predicted RNase H-like HicB family nuclease
MAMPSELPKIAIVIEFVVEPDEDGFFAYCPALDGLFASGETEAELEQSMRDAATAYLHSLIKHGDPIPVGCLSDASRSPVSPQARHQKIPLALAAAT